MIEIPAKRVRASETPIMNAALLALNRLPRVKAMRNNVGKLEDATGRWVTYGLGDGSPDIVGIITIGTERFPIACAFSIEIKRPGGYTKPDRLRLQEAWRRAAVKRGMLSELAFSADEAVAIVERMRLEYTRRLLVLE